MDDGRGREEAILYGSELRLRPVLMTAATTALGLLPLVWASGVGSEVQRPLEDRAITEETWSAPEELAA